MLTGTNFIGARESATGSKTFTGVNPATGEDLPTTFTEATTSEVAEAASAAGKAFDAYRATTPKQRATFLEAIAEEILALGDELLERASSETALPAPTRLTGERGRTCNQLKLFAAVVRDGSWVDARIDHGDPERTPFPKPDVRSCLNAIGPVAVFGASNFPLAFSTAGGDTASALAAGCPVVCKAHPAHPGASELVSRAILAAAKKTGMPDGVYSMVHGGVEAGLALVNDPHIKAVGFTGSLGGGRAIYNAAAARPEPIPVYAEMGSINPVFMLPGAVAERAEAIGSGLAGSITLGVGQFCTNPGLILAEPGEATQSLVASTVSALNESADGTMLTAGIHAAYEAGVSSLATKTERLTTPGQAAFFQTDAPTFLSSPELSHEVFGPSSLLVTGSRAELLKIAENLEGHLTATIHGTEDDLANAADLIAVLEKKVGRIVINGFPTGVEVCHAMVHGGPYPATTDPRSTSVGPGAILRFARPVCYQNMPDALLPAALREANPEGLNRLVDGTRM